MFEGLSGMVGAGTASGIATSIWLAMLWFAAPVLDATRSNDAASRLRDTLILGVAIPGVLASTNALYGASCFVLALLLMLARCVRHRPSFALPPLGREPLTGKALPAIGVLACAWPLLVRPLLDGDSLSYHLPNAAAWVHAHGFWVTNTRYWWYPGGSELFAAGTFAVAGPYGIPVCGTLALLLLGLRCAAFAERAGLEALAAGAFGVLIVTARFAALQAGNLENDIWLTAFLVEIVWCRRFEENACVRTALVASVIKPVGFLFAAVPLVASRMPPRAALLSAAAFASWCLRDALLWGRAAIPASASSYPHVEATTIAYHGIDGMITLLRAVAGDGIGTLAIATLCVAGLASTRDTPLRIATAAFAAFYLLEPFGFNNAIPQLASGQSLRYLAPALVFGALAALPIAKRAGIAFSAGAIAVSAVECFRFNHIFDADASTHGVLAAVVMAAGVAAIPNRTVRSAAAGFAALSFVAYACRIAGTHAAGYYDDEVGANARGTGVYTWFETAKPKAVVAENVRTGPIAIVSPHTNVTETVDPDECAAAKANAALVVAIDEDRSAGGAAALDRARACGTTLFSSRFAIVVRPRT